LRFFLTNGLIIASFKVFSTYPSDKDELLILRIFSQCTPWRDSVIDGCRVG